MRRRACLSPPLVHNPALVAEDSGQLQGQQKGTRREAMMLAGIDPATGKERPIQIDHQRLRSLPRLGAGRVKEAAYVLPEILLRPTAIFEGLTQEEDESRRGVGWLCYVGRPKHSFQDDGTEVPARSGYVFLAFVNRDWVAYNWYWCKADPKDANLPDGHRTRFRKRLI